MIIVDIRDVQNLQPFVDRLVNSGYKWSSDDTINLSSIEKKECIYINTDAKVLSYSSYSFAKDTGTRIYLCKIITLNEYMENFSKEDLKPGMVVEYKNGERRLVVDINGKLGLISNNSFAMLENFNNSLTCNNHSDLSIVAVYTPEIIASLSTMLRAKKLVWKKAKEVTLTMQEIADKFGISVEQLKIAKG